MSVTAWTLPLLAGLALGTACLEGCADDSYAGERAETTPTAWAEFRLAPFHGPCNSQGRVTLYSLLHCTRYPEDCPNAWSDLEGSVGPAVARLDAMMLAAMAPAEVPDLDSTGSEPDGVKVCETSCGWLAADRNLSPCVCCRSQPLVADSTGIAALEYPVPGAGGSAFVHTVYCLSSQPKSHHRVFYAWNEYFPAFGRRLWIDTWVRRPGKSLGQPLYPTAREDGESAFPHFHGRNYCLQTTPAGLVGHYRLELQFGGFPQLRGQAQVSHDADTDTWTLNLPKAATVDQEANCPNCADVSPWRLDAQNASQIDIGDGHIAFDLTLRHADTGQTRTVRARLDSVQSRLEGTFAPTDGSAEPTGKLTLHACVNEDFPGPC